MALPSKPAPGQWFLSLSSSLFLHNCLQRYLLPIGNVSTIGFFLYFCGKYNVYEFSQFYNFKHIITPNSLKQQPQDVANGLPIEQVVDKLVSRAVDLVLRLVIAIVVFYLGKLIINKIYKSVNKILHRRQVDRSLATFVLSLVKIVMLFILIIISISILGIETSSFIALFASAGVAVGMALSGTLQNFAGGVLILLLKPYKVGDFIEFQGFTGKVKEIQIFNTILNTGDNKWISIPNGGLSTGSINNYSREDYRRIDWTISIAYGDDYEVAKREILRIVNEDDRIVKKYIEDDRAMRFKDSDVSPKQKMRL